MRIEVNLYSLRNGCLSLNYNYYLSSLIYRIVGAHSRKFAMKLHKDGFKSDGKIFKAFTFSKIFYFDGAYVEGGNLILPQNCEVSFLVSSPYEEFVKSFALGLTKTSKIWIGKKSNLFELKSVELVFEPEIFDGDPLEEIEVKGVFISPLVVSKVDSLGRKVYLGCFDAEVPYLVRENLFKKFNAFYKFIPEDYFEFNFSTDYLMNHDWQKLIAIKEGTPEETKVKGMLAPFTLKGTRRLVKFSWEIGLGEKNSMGFGMWDIKRNGMGR
jgi:CRISPR-associated endoribonuclease Cas6